MSAALGRPEQANAPSGGQRVHASAERGGHSMSGTVLLSIRDAVATVTLSNPGKLNAMSRHMWQDLRAAFEQVHADTQVRCVIVCGEHDNFCAGGDISEYAGFRFEAASLRDFHENDVWPALQAMLDCDVPTLAQIQGNCMGAGMEIASCCDIRLAGASARFGAPIARLGFPMAPREAALVARETGLTVVRQMLLEAMVFSAADMKASGFLSRLLPDAQLLAEAQTSARRMAALAPQAARMNKQTIRTLLSASSAGVLEDEQSYAYADSAEHREGIAAFLEKRKPVF
jgi:enoyl-CoA hydratase/carnithine racemase